MATNAGNVERPWINFSLRNVILFILIICSTYGMKESYTELQYNQIDFTHFQLWSGPVPDLIGKRPKQVRTRTYTNVSNIEKAFFAVIKSKYGLDLALRKLLLAMGGTGSGRKAPKTTTLASKKVTPNMKLGSNLTSLGFTNSHKSNVTEAGKTKATLMSDNDDDITIASQDTVTTSSTSHKSNETGNTRMNFDMIPGLEDGDMAAKAPVAKAMLDSKRKDTIDKLVKTHKIQIQYRTKTDNRDINVIEKMKCIMARLFQYDKTLQLIPFGPDNKSNPITITKDIPHDQDGFQVYVPDSSVHPKSKMLRMSFKITSEKRLWQLKSIYGIKNYLAQYNIYLEETFLGTLDNVKVGGLVLTHPQFTRRDTAIHDLNKRLNENEDMVTPIQLSPTNLWNTNGSKISTKVLAVECAREHAQMVKNRLFTKLMNVPESMKYSNTRYFKYIPFNATGVINDKVIRSGIYLQNKYLIQTTAITIINMKSLSWAVPNTEDTFQALALNANVPGTTSKIFTSIEIGIMDNKAHLLTTKLSLEAATAWVDTFLLKLNNMMEGCEFWTNLTGFNNPPVRFDRPVVTDAHAAYANYLQQSIGSLIGESSEESGAPRAPVRRSYSRVVYGDATVTKSSTTSPTTPPAQSTAISSITTHGNNTFKKDMREAVHDMQEESKKGQKEMRRALLEEMKQIKEDHTSRTEKVEESLEVFEHMMKELHESNIEKSKEMSTYQKRLSQIGMATAKTASAVEDLKNDMNEKVDKLNLTMQAFIRVMTDVVTNTDSTGQSSKQQKDNLLELARLLQGAPNQVSENMELEDDNTVVYTQPVTPSPGIRDALRGEGDKK